MINDSQLSRIYPSSSANRRRVCLPGLQHAISLTHAGETVNRTAGILATVGVETGELKWMEEIWGPTPAQLTYVGRMGNRTLAEAKRYRGRGFVMLTGRKAYIDMAGDLDCPELITCPPWAARPLVSGQILAEYWNDRNINDLCDAGRWQAVRKAVNGGLNGWDVFMTLVTRAREVLS